MIKYLLALSILLWSCDKSNGNELLLNENEETEEVENQDTLSNDDPAPEELPDTAVVAIDESFYLYIGTYTNESSKGIYLAEFDADSGIFSTPEIVTTLNNPSFQCITPDQNELWSVNESWNGPGQVVGFSINPANGKLTELAKYGTSGNGPCYVSYHQESQTVLAANYNSGNVIRVGVGESNAGISWDHQHEGTGPNKSRQSSPHAHCIKIDLNRKYAYSCDLGADKIYVYNLEESGLPEFATIKTKSGAGPRHLDFHPEMKAMSFVNELNSSIETYLPDENGCFTKFLSAVTTIPTSHTGNNQCADIHYSSDGKFLYASNRGHNSIVTYSINEQTMEPTLIQWMEEEINWPRNFAIDPNDNFIIVANQESNLITVYQIDQKTGQLTFNGNKISISKPVCLTFLKKSENDD